MDNFKSGMVFSAVFHVGIAYVSIAGLPQFLREPPSPYEVISIDFVEIDDFDRAVAKETKSSEEKQVTSQLEEIKMAEAEPIEPNEANAVPLPEKIIPKKTVVKKPEPKRRASPRITPRLKPKPPSKLNRSRLAALIDRSKKKSTTEASNIKVPVGNKDDASEKAAPVMTAIELGRATATIKTALQQMVGECWNPPTGAAEAEDLKVRVRIFFNVDGDLAKPPEIMDKSRMNSNAFYRVAAESAARAIRRCAPYDLPKDKYEIWRQSDFIFDPSEMLGN